MCVSVLAVGDIAAAVNGLLLVSFINSVFNYLDVIVFTGEEAGEGGSRTNCSLTQYYQCKCYLIMWKDPLNVSL